jgi:uncharacterized protein DUF2630
MADDKDVLDHINELAHEEHELFEKESRGEATVADKERLKDVGVKLDQCWDLLHQRRARRSAGLDPNGADVRDEKTVEGYVN